ncbi:MAG TPA: hypothetical protein VNT54_05405 [Solirubrobacteraceae bacterium]|nr:hypothetical protein [Solirubrobacteraceae bacterium]
MLLLGGAIAIGACGSPDDEPARSEPPNASSPPAPAPAGPGAGAQHAAPVAGRRERKVPWELADSRERARILELEVTLGGPPCDALTAVDVRESSARVVVTLHAGRVPGARCGPGTEALVGTFRVIAQLAAPLGRRTLVDGARQ